MNDFFNPTDKAAIDALLRDVNGLKDDWWTGKNCGYDIIEKDRNGNVIQILLYEMGLSGSVDLTKLPPKLKKLYLYSNELSGHLDLQQLPSSVEWLNLSYNSFTTIKIGNLPQSLSELYVNKNKLRGVVLKPASVKNFDTYDNEDLIVRYTREEYDEVIAEMTACVRLLREAKSSSHDAHVAFRNWAIAQQTVNFLVEDVHIRLLHLTNL